ncbi:TIGR03085 family metal-binding protein [Allobranchiibius sp. GilTou38]|uniref:TIGR03085 family metal-binding protein n=1 Tax=Allobranchiibius sp. GilTou38 TaxID=2815210 RepID=UPI001AA15727|nr:TIGR03085 family metal-binding protein [Allobranchiibius sp. GilTou38]MBO1766270.1 TIGR03085 family protein [Allobranchiibius sp. GilTou38]
MPNIAQQERAAICRTFIEVGPDAPTLDGDWRARDLAAHLILRERRPDAALGAVLPALADRTERIQRELAAKDFPGLVEQIRQGPPVWHPARISKIDMLSNLGEFFVHHEDVLRGGESWQRRELSPQLSQALWDNLPQVARLAMRDVRVGVVADAPGVGRRSIRKPKDEHGSVVLTGRPGEIFLSVFGRDGVAEVTFDGADVDVAAYRESKRGV